MLFSLNPKMVFKSIMSTEKNGSLKQTVNDLKQILNSSLGENKEHASTIDQIEKIVESIEGKLNNLDFAAEPVIAEANTSTQLTTV